MAVTNFESGSSFPPLPPGKSGRKVTRSSTFIDIEILGSLVGNDIYSSNWDGSIPLNIGDSGDLTGTTGYGLDASTGHIQATRLFVAPGQLIAPAVSYVDDATTGFFFFGAGLGPDGGDGAIGATCSGGASWTLNNASPTKGAFAVVGDGKVDIQAVRGRIICGGFADELFTYERSPTAQSGTVVVLYANGTDYDLVPQSSTRRHKKFITRRDDLADIELVPSRYQRRGRKPPVGQQRPEGDNPWEYGLIAEDLIKQDSTLGVWDQNVGQYNDYHDRAVIAVLAAKANRSDSDVVRLNDDVVRLNDDVAALTVTVTTLMDRVAELESRLAESPV